MAAVRSIASGEFTKFLDPVDGDLYADRRGECALGSKYDHQNCAEDLQMAETACNPIETTIRSVKQRMFFASMLDGISRGVLVGVGFGPGICCDAIHRVC